MSEDARAERRYTSTEVVLLEDVYKAIHDRRCGCDREVCTDETDYWDAADAVLPIVEDHAKAERKAGAVDALREVETARDEAETRLADTNEPMSRTVLHAAAWGALSNAVTRVQAHLEGVVNADELAAETKTDRIVRLALAAGRHRDDVVAILRALMLDTPEDQATHARLIDLTDRVLVSARGLCEKAGIDTEEGR
jgi:hypothetical protein